MRPEYRNADHVNPSNRHQKNCTHLEWLVFKHDEPIIYLLSGSRSGTNRPPEAMMMFEMKLEENKIGDLEQLLKSAESLGLINRYSEGIHLNLSLNTISMECIPI